MQILCCKLCLFKACNKEILQLLLGNASALLIKLTYIFSRGNLCLPVKCNGYIDCPWLTSNDEANCFDCQSSYLPNRCDCNKPEAMKCGNGIYLLQNGIYLLQR